MDVIILDRKVSLPVTTVIIGKDAKDLNDEKLHMFFCNNCQNPIAQHKGRVLSIMPGSAPLGLPVLLKCLRCGTIYQINDII